MNFNLNELVRKLGRRADGRFYIPGASISWKPDNQKAFPDESTPLSDISSGGLSLLSNNPSQAGSAVSLVITLPQEADPLKLIGKVKYCVPRGPRLTYRYRIGVQLRKFGRSEGCNSMESLNVIEALQQKYGKRPRR